MNKIKQVILIRRDLKMRRGKEVAQGSHAAMEFLLAPLRSGLSNGVSSNGINSGSINMELALTELEKTWIIAGMAKVCLQVNSEQALLEYHEQALRRGLKSYLITDSGRTEFAGVATLTACAIGPDDALKIDEITADLKLY